MLNYLKIILIVFLNFFYHFSTSANSCCSVITGNTGEININIVPYPGGGGGGSGGGIKPPTPMEIEAERFSAATLAQMYQHQERLNQISHQQFKESLKLISAIKDMHERHSSYQPNNLKLLEYKETITDNLSSSIPSDSSDAVKGKNLNITSIEKNFVDPFQGKTPEAVVYEIEKGIVSTSLSEAQKMIRKGVNLFTEYQKEKNPERKAEIGKVINKVFNENGVFKKYIQYYPKLKNYKLKTTVDIYNYFEVARNLQNINHALHVMKHSYSPMTIERAERVIENALKADLLLANNLLEQAKRYTSRGYVFSIFQQNKQNGNFNNRKYSRFTNEYLNVDESIKAVNSYEHYYIMQTANDLSYALYLNKSLPADYQVLSQISLNQLQDSAKNNDIPKFEDDIDNAWKNIDTMSSIGSGVAKGVYQVVEDTVTGVYELVTHPVDSAIAIADALYNYDRTYSIIVDKIKSDVENFHTLSTEEKAKFITKTTLEIATLITPRGLLKNTVELKKIADASYLASNKIVNHYAKALAKDQILLPDKTFVSQTIPGGNLLASEGDNLGHTIKKHSGLENAELKNRALNDHKVSGGKTSTFPNVAIAEQAIANTISQNKVNIENWLRDPKMIKPKKFNSITPSCHFTGISYDKYSDQFTSVSNTRVVLKKSKDFPEGYFILTAFPIE